MKSKLLLVCPLLLLACEASPRFGDDARGLRPPRPGDPLEGLTAEQLALFAQGEADFEREMTPADGLGPVFIERACVSCHALGGTGGGDPLDDPNHLVQRFGTLNADGTYNNLAALGGDVLQTRSISAGVPSCQVAPEQVPPQATIHALRNPLPMFGIGLIAAIPDATLLAGAVDKGDGVHGRPNLAPNGRPGRFGWKAQTEDLAPFNATAANGTMGITSPFSPGEQRPQGQPLPAGCNASDLGAQSPNDPGAAFIHAVTAWEVMLAPPGTRPIEGVAARGAQVFEDIGCAKCHVPAIETGDFDLALAGGARMRVDAVSRKRAALYSDLLLHDMGPEMNEGVTMRQARGSEFRTAPLWGLRLRTRFLHDGRARSVDEAIAAHGGTASVVRARWESLDAHDAHALSTFLERL